MLKSKNLQVGWLQSLEHKMVEESMVLAFNRLETLSLLKESLELIRNTTPFQPGYCIFQRELKKNFFRLFFYRMWEVSMLQQLERSREEDSFSGKSTIGAHKMDFNFNAWGENIEAKFCSTGEQKNLLWIDVIVLTTAKNKI